MSITEFALATPSIVEAVPAVASEIYQPTHAAVETGEPGYATPEQLAYEPQHAAVEAVPTEVEVAPAADDPAESTVERDEAITLGVEQIRVEARENTRDGIVRASMRLAETSGDPTVLRFVREIQDGQPMALAAVRELSNLLDQAGARGFGENESWEARRYVAVLTDFADRYYQNSGAASNSLQTAAHGVNSIGNTVSQISGDELPTSYARLQGLAQGEMGDQPRQLIDENMAAVSVTMQDLSNSLEGLNIVRARLNDGGAMNYMPAGHVLHDVVQQVQAAVQSMAAGNRVYEVSGLLQEVNRYLLQAGASGEEVARESMQTRTALEDVSNNLAIALRSGIYAA